MDIVKALRAEESKFLQQLDAAQQQLNTVRAAIKLFLGEKNSRKAGHKKPHFSASARARMSKAQKARWAKIKAAKKNA
jgi:hypothetical protein